MFKPCLERLEHRLAPSNTPLIADTSAAHKADYLAVTLSPGSAHMVPVLTMHMASKHGGTAGPGDPPTGGL